MTPAWHDVPPVPGDYQVAYDGDTRLCQRVHVVGNYSVMPGRKFYGPLPDPPPIPEPPKPPRFFTAKTRAEGHERYGIVRGNRARVFTGDFRHGMTVDLDFLDTYYTDIRWYAPETA